MKKQLILHVGMTKTGSTAIQHFLEKNARLLEERGILYPKTEGHISLVEEDSYVSAGNAHYLSLTLDCLASNEPDTSRKVKDWVDNVYQTARTADCDIVFLSSENLCKLDAPALVLLKECLDPFFDIVVVGFKRDPYAWLFSSWLQVVKREGSAEWFGDVDVDLSLKPFLIEKHLQSIFPTNHHFLDYEKYKKNLVSGMFSALRLSERVAGIPYTPDQIVNRSLSCDELYLALKVNAVSGGNIYLSEAISKEILLEKNDKSCFFYLPAIHDQIKHYFRRNKLSFKKRDYSNAPQISSYAEWAAPFKDKHALSVRLLSSIVSFYKGNIENFIGLAYEKVFFYRESPYLRYTPNDFDAFTYCMLNTDVLNSDIDPYRHYVEFGCTESRSYIVPQGVRAIVEKSR